MNIFPSLIHVPDWLPGTGWKQTAREWRTFKDRALSIPYGWTKAQIVKYYRFSQYVGLLNGSQAAGAAEPSILSMLLQDHSVTSNLSAKEKESCFKEHSSIIVAGRFLVNDTTG